MRFVILLTILLGLYAGTTEEFSTYFSTSRFVVFLPFFMMGYLWKYEWTEKLRKSYYKWGLAIISILILVCVVKLMSAESISVGLFRQNQSYHASGVRNLFGMGMRFAMYIGATSITLTLVSITPDKKNSLTFLGENTMTIYLFHYPIFILLNGFNVLEKPLFTNMWGCLMLSAIVVLLLGNHYASTCYKKAIDTINGLLFNKNP